MNREALLILLSKVRYWIAFVGLRRVISGVISVLVAGVLLWLVLKPSPMPIESSIPLATFPVSTSVGPTAKITVHVAGAVEQPGVYKLAPLSRVIDAVTAAGGARRDADLERINLAQLVIDTEQVFIPIRTNRATAPSREPPSVTPRHRPTTTIASGDQSTSGGSNPQQSPMVNLNSATALEIDALPGVGPATAKAIVDYRRSKGKFSKVEELLNVSGIGPAKFAALRDLVTVS